MSAQPYYADDAVTLHHGDALALPLVDATVDLVVTSPPYFGLRSYRDGGEHYAGQIGSEATPAEFVDALISATAEMMRVLKPSGSIWVNLGDKYAGRSLLGLPWRYAIRCIDELGLTLRSEVIWSKAGKGFIDARASDRMRRTHETWFHLTRSTHYFHSSDVRVPAANATERPQRIRAEELFAAAGLTPEHRSAIRAVGIIDSKGAAVRSGGRWGSASGALAAEARSHLGSYYREFCGGTNNSLMPPSVLTVPVGSFKVPKGADVTDHFAAFPMEWPSVFIRGWSPIGGVVLDPFGGTGTTALVARVLGRRGVYVDLSTDYCRLAQWRVNDPGQIASAMQVEKVATPMDDQGVFDFGSVA
ncbi:MAG: site-specific DNA-methyltransferase [Actinomycetales bacterium]|nr:site-specific DNA-methyltransferase [Actinomycetales bacterium]